MTLQAYDSLARVWEACAIFDPRLLRITFDSCRLVQRALGRSDRQILPQNGQYKPVFHAEIEHDAWMTLWIRR
jgi:hypothetical protein